MPQKPLTPPDRQRCQADIKDTYGAAQAFQLGYDSSRNGRWFRCDDRPTVVVEELQPDRDGLKGQMSLCSSCHAELHKHMPGHAYVVEIIKEEP